MEEYGETKDKEYPRGRGYGNDYMRGGEVFGGYGYSQRADYDRPRGDGRSDDNGQREMAGDDEEADPPSPPSHSADRPAGGDENGAGRDAAEDVERFPQDERAGGWDIPHDIPADGDDASAGPAMGAGVLDPTVERPTFGDTGGSLTHSRSYYVTQAQLQSRRPTETRG